MAIAHICLNCARDLARQPAIRDPHYALPLVICPDCNKASVRRPNHYYVSYKNLLRIFTVFKTLLIQAFFSIALAAATVAWVFLIGNAIIHLKDNDFSLLPTTNVMVAFALTSIATGAWLTAGLSHIPKLKTWIAWTVLLVIVNAISLITYFISQDSIDAPLGLAFVGLIMVNILSLIPIIAIMIIAMLGIPLGKLCLYLHRIFARESWQWRKKRRTLGRNR